MQVQTGLKWRFEANFLDPYSERVILGFQALSEQSSEWNPPRSSFRTDDSWFPSLSEQLSERNSRGSLV
jgi:hypothetical protein